MLEAEIRSAARRRERKSRGEQATRTTVVRKIVSWVRFLGIGWFVVDPPRPALAHAEAAVSMHL